MDGGLVLREITSQLDGDAPAAAPGGPLNAHEPRIALTVAGPAGDRQTFTIPRRLVAGRELTMGGILLLAMDHDGDGEAADAAEIARRRTFIHQVRSWLPQADSVHYSMMLRRASDGETTFVEPGTPVDISRHQDQDQSFHISFAQVYTGGGK